MSKRPCEPPRNLPEIVEIPDEQVEPPDDPNDSILNNNAFMFNDVQIRPNQIILDANNAINDFFIPNFERFAYANKATANIWEPVLHESQLIPEDYVYQKISQAYVQPQISPENTKNLSTAKSTFCEFMFLLIENVLLIPTNFFLRSKRLKVTTCEEILQLFLFEMAMVCTAEKHSEMQPNVAIARRSLFKNYGILGKWPSANRLQQIRSHLR